MLRTDIAGRQHAQSEWQNQVGGEMKDVLRRPGQAAQNATRVLQHEGSVTIQEDRMRHHATEAESLSVEHV